MAYRVTVTDAKGVLIKEVEGLTLDEARSIQRGWAEGITLRIFHKVTSVAIVDEDTHLLDHTTVWGVHRSDLISEDMDLLPAPHRRK
jgi:hypothetical protein